MRLVIFLLSFILSTICIAQEGITEKGLKYKFHQNSSGATPKIGDLVSLHMVIKNNKDEAVRNSYDEGKPLLFPVKYTHFDGDIYEAVSLMSENDSASFWVNADSMYLKIFKKPLPDNIKSGTDLTITIKTFKIRSQNAYKNEQSEFYNQHLKEPNEIVEKRKKEEEIKIQNYIKNSGYTFKKTSKGVYYSLINTNSDKYELPKKDNAVVFHYVGQLLDGSTFESSYDDIGHTITFTLGANDVIEGWEDVFPLIGKGQKAKIIIPSHLAYGNLAKGKIPANSVLVFDIHLVAIY